MMLTKLPGTVAFFFSLSNRSHSFAKTGSSNVLALRAALGAFVATTTLTPQVDSFTSRNYGEYHAHVHI